MRRPDPDILLQLSHEKRQFACHLAEKLVAIDGVVSVTYTGSFVEKPGIVGISDIDTVVVVENLTWELFQQCSEVAKEADCSLLGLASSRVILNSSFGPLKFDEESCVVIHLMIYSVGGHRTHVLKSPFTCLDWERSKVCWGRSLREIYPVLRLQPRQFLDSRRGINDYLDDLEGGVIQYREYAPSGNGILEVALKKQLDSKHVGEFAYHIVKNLIINYLKLLSGVNLAPKGEELFENWRLHLPETWAFSSWFRALVHLKEQRVTKYPGGTVSEAKAFLACFDHTIKKTWNDSADRLIFVRHARTALNDGRFLGRRSDPPICETTSRLELPNPTVFSSPALRARQTAALLVPDVKPVCISELSEIDYGDVEGYNLARLETEFPEIPSAWARGDDPRFPSGENTRDVDVRLDQFLSRTHFPKTSVIVTHNVVLRVLVGKLLGLPMKNWHLIPIGHCETLEVLRFNGSLYLNLSPIQMERLTDALVAKGVHA